MTKKYHTFISILLIINIILSIIYWFNNPDIIMDKITSRNPEINGPEGMVIAIITGSLFLGFMFLFLFPLLFLSTIFLIVSFIKIFKTTDLNRKLNILYSVVFIVLIVFTILNTWVL